ncbi:DNA-binding protein [Pararhizobium sp. BT-229]|uniref:DNA-binding protein n=1 Tax=Pararhizobium sp. BT-229 TaxID=2986923 RepID=UPI0021F703D8|nr:DNA-binding protein [Pararhizobium sp. BT-229]MCV9962591.1 DNA-binding protein [Pararhizobium sp. BT-229]
MPNKDQIDKFKEAARELETDDDEARFNKTLGKLAKSPPPSKDGKPTKDKKPRSGE